MGRLAHRENSLAKPQVRRRLSENGQRNAFSEQLWMRSISFAGLHRILHVIASSQHGLTAAELNALVTKGRLYHTRRGAVPAPTTLYHCRNTLLKLNAVVRDGRQLVANIKNHNVRTLLEYAPPEEGRLNDSCRVAFAELVLANHDCKKWFFNL